MICPATNRGAAHVSPRLRSAMSDDDAALATYLFRNEI
jgi:hypothetical protein